jgi:hypothetical protein
MHETIRPAYSKWPAYDAALRAAVAGLTDEQLAIRPSPDRWPLWATVGHVACQRVSGLCGLLGEPGADSTPFPDALFRCPGDEYLAPAMSAGELVAALASTFRIVEHALDTWTFDMLGEEVHRTFGEQEERNLRGTVLQGSFAHDIWHGAELNESLVRLGLATVDFWG